ncbi:hypothetical protein HD553DRAFT_21996 [Filobasidium floriforme]|uniref:uncharacterized protein n=1 Tax=Filobasidium floriforme TaxID=5210 RepID=UPI001E8D4325|nr:uncharacterized protein HD553DRAFT_21996 [Filobasidium floriforme]KAH8090974.1 hypothetical protein HD553DRAFT_21996 [Filobasidium floriforme]
MPNRSIITVDLFKVDPAHLPDLNSRLTSLWAHYPIDLVVGTSSLTDPIERSRGFQSILLRRHETLDECRAFEEKDSYQDIIRTGLQDHLRFTIETDLNVVPSTSTEIEMSDLLIHVVLFKFKPDHTAKISQFQTEIQNLSHLSCVTSERLVCQGPVRVPVPPSSAPTASASSEPETDDALRQGYHLCLISHHPGLPGLAAYQSSAEHHDVTTRLMFPFKEELTRFDFLVDPSRLSTKTMIPAAPLGERVPS